MFSNSRDRLIAASVLTVKLCGGSGLERSAKPLNRRSNDLLGCASYQQVNNVTCLFEVMRFPPFPHT